MIRFGEHGAASSRAQSATKFRRIRRPASPDFSGWNCTPPTRPCSTAAAKASPCAETAQVAPVSGAAYECVK